MSKPVKEMIIADYQQRFSDVDSAVVIEVRGMNANDNNALRGELAKSNIRVTIVKNTLANKAFSGGPLEGLAPALSGPSALATGAESVVEVARELVRCAKEFDDLELKAAILDGEFFEGTDGVKRLSDPQGQASRPPGLLGELNKGDHQDSLRRLLRCVFSHQWRSKARSGERPSPCSE